MRALLAAGLALATAGLAAPAWAGAWVRDDGEGLAILKYSHWRASDAFDDDGSRVPFPDGGRSRLGQLNLYLEYGASERITLVGNFYANRVEYRSRTFEGQNTGLGDQEFGLRYRLGSASADSPWVSAVQGLANVPGYDSDDVPALGLGGGGFELRYSAGRPFAWGARNGYVDLGAALRRRAGNPADEVRADAVVGLALAQDWQGIAELNLIKGLGNGRGYNPVNFIDSNDYDLAKVQLSALRSFGPAARLQLGYSHDIAGRNTGAGGGPFVALWWFF